MQDIKIYIYHKNKCDRKKCTALKMGKFEMAKIVHNMNDLPYGTIVLDPFSDRIISPEDRKYMLKSGLLAIDTSWNDPVMGFKKLEKIKRGYGRRLPDGIVPVNPVNYGHIGKLSTLEAVAATLFIVGNEEQAYELLRLYKWAPHFLDLNRKILG